MSGCWTSRALRLVGRRWGRSVEQVVRTLTNRVDAGLFTTSGVTNGRTVGVFEPVQTGSWSAMRGAAAATYSAYRGL